MVHQMICLTKIRNMRIIIEFKVDVKRKSKINELIFDCYVTAITTIMKKGGDAKAAINRLNHLIQTNKK